MQNTELIYGLFAAVAFLMGLVYLMYKEGSRSTWKEISKNAKEKIREEMFPKSGRNL